MHASLSAASTTVSLNKEILNEQLDSFLRHFLFPAPQVLALSMTTPQSAMICPCSRSDGSKVRASGKDGEDAIAPRLKIEGEYWYMSTDGGVTWTKMAKATGADGTPGASGCLFAKVTYDSSFVYLELNDGTLFKVGRGASCVRPQQILANPTTPTRFTSRITTHA